MYDVSVIVTTYNAEDTVNRAVSSLLHKPFMERIEVIIVDDCSKDGTPQIIQSIAEKNDNVKVILLDKNTGSPSEPRNVGMRNATGEYITFLDDDDWLDVKNLLELVQYAKANGLECVKGYLSVVDKKGVTISNRIVDRKYNTIIKDILAQQSTTIDVVLKREFLVKHQIAFDKSYKIGEDTLFYAECFSKNPKIEYVDKSYYFYNKSRGVELSTTQQYGDRELEMHIEIWNLVEEKLKSVGISYYQLRLSVAVKNSVKNLVVEESKLVSKKVFLLFSEFLNKEKAYLKNKVYLEQRYQEVLDTLYAGDYQKFCQVSKKRILIAGYDLKFILPLVSYLEQHYMVLIDEWTGHNSHNEKQSKELLEQADIIWCEWLLGNAVWYSQQKKNYQKIIIRAHRFEITREFGYQVNYDKVSKVLAVGYYYLEEFQRKFHIPRSKMQLLSNYVEPDIYTGEKNEGYQYHIGIVGILPKRKGFFKGLEILKNLRQKDERFQLYEKRLEQVLDTIGFSYLPKDKSVSVYYTIKSFDDLEKMLKNFQQNIYMDKHLKIIYDDADMDLALLRQLEAMGVEFYCKSYLEQYDKDVEDTSAYIAFADETMREDFIEKAIKHFCYLDDNMCVVQKENGCEIEVENNGIKMNSLRRKRNNN